MSGHKCGRSIFSMALIPVISFLLGSSFGDRVVSSCMADLNHNGVAEAIRLEGGSGPFGKYLTLIEADNEIMRIDLSSMKPWKVQTADVDGDGDLELSIGVYTTARSDPETNKRLFIFRLTDHGLHPVWLGTRLSKPFEDYVFFDMNCDGRDELIAIEYLADGKKVLNVYGWKGFGFAGLCQSQGFQDIRELRTGSEGEELSAMAAVDGKALQRVILYYENDVLILKQGSCNHED